MSASNRADILTKTAKVIKKHFKPAAPPSDRSVLEHLLYACCLEKSKHDVCDDVFAKLQASYYDWNEVRVTTIAELAEVMAPLNDPQQAASRLKRALQGVFEKYYSFDIDILRKGNLGKAVKEFESINGITPFGVSYVAQNALSGHSIPVNSDAFRLFIALDVITEAEASSGRVPGLERTVPKTKGVEFGSLLHQLAVDYATSPFSPKVRSIILEIDPTAKDRLPKRAAKKTGKKAASKKTSKAKPAVEPDPAQKTAKKSSTKRLAKKKPR
jgi:endonuclease-3